MAKSCPHCGAEIEYSEADARLLTGACAGCGTTVTVVSGVAVPVGAGPAVEGASAPEGVAASVALRCSECDGPLVLRATEDGGLEAECAECESVVTFVRSDAAAENEDEDERPRRAPSETAERSPRREFRRAPPAGRGEFAPSNARPCRQCGAPLKFSTQEDGTLMGECAQCGNRFTLPPRRDGGGGGGRYPPRGGGGYGRGPRRYGSSGGRSGPPGRSYGTRRPRYQDRDDDEDRDDRRRRRPRRD